MKRLTKELRNKLLDGLEQQVNLFAIAVAPLYVHLNWQWGEGIPDIGNIKKHLYDDIEQLRKSDYVYTDSGGLRVTFEDSDNYGAEVSIKFTFETTVYEDV